MIDKRKVHIPGDDEDRAITEAALADPDSQPLDVAFIARARRGRPEMEPGERKQRVTINLDPDLLRVLKRGGKGWQTRTNALLRHAVGLDENGN